MNEMIFVQFVVQIYHIFVTEWCINWNKTQYKLRSESREFHVFSSLRWETLLSSIRSLHALHRPISERYTVRGRGEYLRISSEDGLVVPPLSLLHYRSSILGPPAEISVMGRYTRWRRQINFWWHRGPTSEEMKITDLRCSPWEIPTAEEVTSAASFA